MLQVAGVVGQAEGVEKGRAVRCRGGGGREIRVRDARHPDGAGRVGREGEISTC